MRTPSSVKNITGFQPGKRQRFRCQPRPAANYAQASDVRAYTITGKGGLDNNYTFSYANADDLAVWRAKALVTVTANGATRVYGDANPGFAGVITGSAGAKRQRLDTAPTYATNATQASSIDTYDYG